MDILPNNYASPETSTTSQNLSAKPQIFPENRTDEKITTISEEIFHNVGEFHETYKSYFGSLEGILKIKDSLLTISKEGILDTISSIFQRIFSPTKKIPETLIFQEPNPTMETVISETIEEPKPSELSTETALSILALSNECKEKMPSPSDSDEKHMSDINGQIYLSAHHMGKSNLGAYITSTFQIAIDTLKDMKTPSSQTRNRRIKANIA